MPRTGEKRLRGEYGNRVQIPDGTAAVCAESPRRKAKAAHRKREGRRGIVTRRESEDLLETGMTYPTDYGLGVDLRRETAAGILYARAFFMRKEIDVLKERN